MRRNKTAIHSSRIARRVLRPLLATLAGAFLLVRAAVGGQRFLAAIFRVRVASFVTNPAPIAIIGGGWTPGAGRW